MATGKGLASRLNKRIRIEQPDLIDNGRGGRTPNQVTGGWKLLAEPWAEILGLRGDEALRLGVERRRQLWRVVIRNRSDVNPGCRIVWGRVVMDIKSAAPNDAGDELVMTCESGANG